MSRCPREVGRRPCPSRSAETTRSCHCQPPGPMSGRKRNGTSDVRLGGPRSRAQSTYDRPEVDGDGRTWRWKIEHEGPARRAGASVWGEAHAMPRLLRAGRGADNDVGGELC
ncbi:hypothetical protein ACCO45_005031 [Purpureocillium lilacinum]|uniref:Uncharacterized protein n=1 Tax=Purpureocillium lilacinum TaxID=33203 RepID=A0ACC4DUA9_PURLI